MELSQNDVTLFGINENDVSHRRRLEAAMAFQQVRERLNEAEAILRRSTWLAFSRTRYFKRMQGNLLDLSRRHEDVKALWPLAGGVFDVAVLILCSFTQSCRDLISRHELEDVFVIMAQHIFRKFRLPNPLKLDIVKRMQSWEGYKLFRNPSTTVSPVVVKENLTAFKLSHQALHQPAQTIRQPAPIGLPTDVYRLGGGRVDRFADVFLGPISQACHASSQWSLERSLETSGQTRTDVVTVLVPNSSDEDMVFMLRVGSFAGQEIITYMQFDVLP
jgi:hypothetical protein